MNIFLNVTVIEYLSRGKLRSIIYLQLSKIIHMKALAQWMIHNRISVCIDYLDNSVDDKLVLVKENIN